MMQMNWEIQPLPVRYPSLANIGRQVTDQDLYQRDLFGLGRQSHGHLPLQHVENAVETTLRARIGSMEIGEVM